MSASDQDAIDRAAARLIDAGLVDEAAFRGCRDDEIDHLEGILGVKLPSIYRRFLARMGRSAGTFLSGTDFLFAGLPELRRQAEEVAAELPRLPPDRAAPPAAPPARRWPRDPSCAPRLA